LAYDANYLIDNKVGIIIDAEVTRANRVERRCRDIGKPVAMIASYDGFYLDPLVSDTLFSMIAYLEKRYYSSASRYTTSAFMRLKLGEPLTERHVAPHIFEAEAEAQQFARSINGTP
jgi:propionate CoA-transferase